VRIDSASLTTKSPGDFKRAAAHDRSGFDPYKTTGVAAAGNQRHLIAETEAPRLKPQSRRPLHLVRPLQAPVARRRPLHLFHLRRMFRQPRLWPPHKLLRGASSGCRGRSAIATAEKEIEAAAELGNSVVLLLLGAGAVVAGYFLVLNRC